MQATNTRDPLVWTPTLSHSHNWKRIFQLTIPGTPPSTNTLYGTTFAHKRRFMTGKGKVYKNIVQDLAIALFKKPAETGTLKYTMRLYFDDTRRRDNANYEKCLVDALQGIIFEDDSQFKVTQIEKHIDKKRPRTEIEIFLYAPTKEMITSGINEVVKELGLPPNKELSSVCNRCPLMFYWVTEQITPGKEDLMGCLHYIRKNIEDKCPKRPRNKNTDDIIKEGLTQWTNQ